jgi:hypothetical protein
VVITQALVGTETQRCSDVVRVRSEPVDEMLAPGNGDLDGLGGSSFDGVGEVEQCLCY